MDRIKKLSYEILAEHKSKFGTNFDENKIMLDKVSIVRSKELRNRLSGYITRTLKREEEFLKEKQRREEYEKQNIENNTSESTKQQDDSILADDSKTKSS